MFTGQSLAQWLEQFRLIIGRGVPKEVNAIDEDDRERTVWWKCKKWASAVVERIFERSFVFSIFRYLTDSSEEVSRNIDALLILQLRNEARYCKVQLNIFRYGSPGQVQLNYSEFAENYMAHFAVPILNTCLQVLDGYGNGSYVSSRVLHSLLQYVDIAVSQSRTWKIIKPHFQVFPHLILQGNYLLGISKKISIF